MAISACGADKPRQDANEPAGKFPLAVSAAKFPTAQRLADTTDLRLEIENTGSEQVPNLAVTIYTGDAIGGGPFTVPVDQPGLGNPNRPVWILESGFPKLVTQGEDIAQIEDAPTAGADAVQTDTFAFGPLDPGATKDIVWRLTPVAPGIYTVNYELAAGLHGKARAVDDDGGGPVEGEFVVAISAKPARTSVDPNGDVVIEKP